jgi:hypothetical protein
MKLTPKEEESIELTFSKTCTCKLSCGSHTRHLLSVVEGEWKLGLSVDVKGLGFRA